MILGYNEFNESKFLTSADHKSKQKGKNITVSEFIDMIKKDKFRIPIEALKKILTWGKIYQSSGEKSFYDTELIDNQYPTVGRLRLSNHWNVEKIYGNEKKIKFEAIGKEIEKNKWYLGKYIGKNKYEIIDSYKSNSFSDYKKWIKKL